jgi:hypothetical protein
VLYVDDFGWICDRGDDRLLSELRTGGAAIITIGESPIDFEYAKGHEFQLNLGAGSGDLQAAMVKWISNSRREKDLDNFISL